MPREDRERSLLPDDPLWYRDAVIYELHVRAFHDSDGDGIGDFRGLTAKLDYLQDLGITALWLLPFYPSPLRDDGYDIADYLNVHPSYGTLADFRHFLRESHRRGIRVITELVVNHTSDQHPWFQKARRSPPGSRWRDYYVWSDTPDRYRETRIIFRDFESSNWSWDPVAKAYYWHRFYSHQPDLNYDNPAVRRAVNQVLDFWLGMGVDGLRLDAVPYLIEREGTPCENLPETHKVLKGIRRRVDEKFRNRMLLAEANQWPEDAVAYFGEGDECHMAFHFPLMPRLFMAVRMEDRYPVIDILTQTPPIPEGCQWALFLRNHDELTLEMVTDEERDYMVRVYADDPQARINLGIRRRLVPLLGKDRRKFELMNALLFSLPGTPVIYYGDEIGMGDNIFLGDRNGVRTPMQWSADRNAGFSRANPQRLYLPVIIDADYHYETVNVEARQNNPSSLLWFMKRILALRKRFRAFGRGTIEFLYPENHHVLAFLRTCEEERILVVANLSRFAQYVELDLGACRGMVPVELFGQTGFPPVQDGPYRLTLSPHAFFWFSLERPGEEEAKAEAAERERKVPRLTVPGPWETLLKEDGGRMLERILPGYLQGRRWFGGKARKMKSARILDAVPLAGASPAVHLLLIRVEYVEEDPEVYTLPVAFADRKRVARIARDYPQAVIAQLSEGGRNGGRGGILYDALYDREACEFLLESTARRRRFKGSGGEVAAVPTKAFRTVRGPQGKPPRARAMRAEQSNTSVVFGDRVILKLFRRVDAGVNPDLEIGAFLTEKARFPHIPPVAGFLEYRRERREPMTLGIFQGFVPNQGDAWHYTLDSLGRYFEQVMARHPSERECALPDRPLIDLAGEGVPEEAGKWLGEYLPAARLLGERTAEMHLALSGETEDRAFAPEPFSTLYQRSLYQSMRNLTGHAMLLLRKRLRFLPEAFRDDARRVLEAQERILSRFREILDRKITAKRIRIHGDYHLGQVLYTGRDFVIIDFEGEPAHTLTARRIKRSPLRDVAGMLRSFHYAAKARLVGAAGGGAIRADDLAALDPWARYWHRWVSAAFLGAYLETASRGTFLPRSREELAALLDTYRMEKAIYELEYELNNRPDWVKLPLRGILNLLDTGE
ncbi:MAG: maltose alpha-D-glucosyltransferase [Deltaproteobacteria bacterium]